MRHNLLLHFPLFSAAKIGRLIAIYNWEILINVFQGKTIIIVLFPTSPQFMKKMKSHREKPFGTESKSKTCFIMKNTTIKGFPFSNDFSGKIRGLLFVNGEKQWTMLPQ